MGWVDADAHVVESPLTWDYLLPSEQKFRPQLFKPEDDNQKALVYHLATSAHLTNKHLLTIGVMKHNRG